MADRKPDKAKTTSGWTLFLTTTLLGPCMLLSHLAARCSINHVKLKDSTVVKKRKWFANLLRVPGNWVLRFRSAPIRVLSTSQWHQREAALCDATSDGKSLSMKRIDGQSLAAYLANCESGDDALAAVTTAMRSLFDFHLQHDQSHGDASSANVMIEGLFDGTLSATWLDFDVAHLDSVSMFNRRADDLRALLFTSKRWLTNEQFASLFHGWDVFYPDENVWTCLQKTMSNPLCHCDIFHLAQIRRVGFSPRRTR